MNRVPLPGPGTFHRPPADVVELTYRATDGSQRVLGPDVEPVDATFEEVEAAWVCPTCLSGLPFPITSCAECLGLKVVPWCSGAGLTSSLIAAVAVIGTLIVSLASLG